MGKQGNFACARALRAHFERNHTPPWLMDVEELIAEKENKVISITVGKSVVGLITQLVDGKITDEEYLEKVKLISYANMFRFPEKVSIKNGLEAINLSLKKESLNIQKSELLRNWMKLISGKPDKINAKDDTKPNQ